MEYTHPPTGRRHRERRDGGRGLRTALRATVRFASDSVCGEKPLDVFGLTAQASPLRGAGRREEEAAAAGLSRWIAVWALGDGPVRAVAGRRWWAGVVCSCRWVSRWDRGTAHQGWGPEQWRGSREESGGRGPWAGLGGAGGAGQHRSSPLRISSWKQPTVGGSLELGEGLRPGEARESWGGVTWSPRPACPPSPRPQVHGEGDKPCPPLCCPVVQRPVTFHLHPDLDAGSSCSPSWPPTHTHT